MDEQSIIGTREQLDARSGEDRRTATDRRRGNHRLHELNARRDGEETIGDVANVGKGIASRLSFLALDEELRDPPLMLQRLGRELLPRSAVAGSIPR